MEQNNIDTNAEKFHSFVAYEIKRGVSKMKSHFTYLTHFISTIINAGNTFASSYLNDKVNVLKDKTLHKEGCWQCSVCINAETLDLHTEKDATYTIITTPFKNISSLSYCFWF